MMKPQATFTRFPQATRGLPARSVRERAKLAQARMEEEARVASAARQAARLTLVIGLAAAAASVIVTASAALR